MPDGGISQFEIRRTLVVLAARLESSKRAASTISRTPREYHTAPAQDHFEFLDGEPGHVHTVFVAEFEQRPPAPAVGHLQLHAARTRRSFKDSAQGFDLF